MRNIYVRQGDLLFRKVDGIVEGKPLKELVIAEGEFTGHKHVLVAMAGAKIVGTHTKFSVKGKAKLVHPEHGNIGFGEGTYIVIPEREFDYVDEELKTVKD